MVSEKLKTHERQIFENLLGMNSMPVSFECNKLVLKTGGSFYEHQSTQQITRKHTDIAKDQLIQDFPHNKQEEQGNYSSFNDYDSSPVNVNIEFEIDKEEAFDEF